LTKAAAEELGLNEGTPVAVSIIDAHAGGLGLLGAPLAESPTTISSITPELLEERLALISGSSLSLSLCLSPPT